MSLLAVLAVLCTAWQYRLERNSLPWTWSIPLAVSFAVLLLTILLRIPLSTRLRAGTLLAGLLFYGMISALTGRDSKRSLQALASIALLLPLALFGGPQIQLAAICVGLLAMLRCGRRYGGYLQSALLVFTPAALCVIVSLILRSLSIANVPFPELRFDLLQLAEWHYASGNEFRLLSIAPVLAVALVSLLVRMLEGRASVADFAFLVLLAGMVSALLLRPTIRPVTMSEIGMISCSGAMSMIAAAPPRRSSLRFLLLLVSALAVSLQATILR